MNHSFNVEIAEEYGIEEAIILENLAFWIVRNIANNKNLIDGKTWVFNSASALNEIFPYINPSKIRRCLIKLEEKKVLISGNYNKKQYDRTKWYTIVHPEILKVYNIHSSICKMDYSNCNFDVNKMQNAIAQNGEPIPDIKENVENNIKEDINKYKDVFDYYLTLDLVKHKKYTPAMSDAIKKAEKAYKLSFEDMKTLLKRHDTKVKFTKGKEYETKARTITEFFGQKKYQSTDLICADYLDEVWDDKKYYTKLPLQIKKQEQEVINF